MTSLKPLPMLALVLMITPLALPAAAQSPASAGDPALTPPQDTSSRTVAAPAGPSPGFKLGGVTFSGSFRARVENWGWFEAPAGEDSYTFGALNLRLALEQKAERF